MWRDVTAFTHLSSLQPTATHMSGQSMSSTSSSSHTQACLKHLQVLDSSSCMLGSFIDQDTILIDGGQSAVCKQWRSGLMCMSYLTSPDRTDSSTRQPPCRRTMSQVALPRSTTTMSPGTSRWDDTPLQHERETQQEYPDGSVSNKAFTAVTRDLAFRSCRSAPPMSVRTPKASQETSL